MAAKLVILIGPPAAGKSTWREKFDGEVISTDDIRREIFGVKYDPGVEPAVWRLAYKRLEDTLKAGKRVCFDATNITRNRRRPLIKIGKRAGAAVEGVVFLRDLNTLLRNEANRPLEKRVGEKIIRAKHEQLEMPSYDEGFDELHFIK